MTTQVDIGTLIHSRPGLKGGRPCLAGTGMTVHAIAVLHQQGMSAKQILEEFPHLDLARIYAAVTYYHANREQIEADLEADERLSAEGAARFPKGVVRREDVHLM